jgi:hypothetical protein
LIPKHDKKLEELFDVELKLSFHYYFSKTKSLEFRGRLCVLIQLVAVSITCCRFLEDSGPQNEIIVE